MQHLSQLLALLLVLIAVSQFIEIAQANLTKAQKQLILDTHNKQRSFVANGKLSGYPTATNMALMHWDETMVKDIKRVTDGCVMKHDSYGDRKFGSYQIVGQNLAMWTGNYHKDVSGPVEAWYGEYKDYNFNSKSCSGVCGHFTQNVWSGSLSIGCALTDCNGKKIFGCNYAPGGNFNLQKNNIYKSGKPCSACPLGYDKCMAGVCATSSECSKAGASCSSSTVTGTKKLAQAASNPDGIIARVPGAGSGGSSNSGAEESKKPDSNTSGGGSQKPSSGGDSSAVKPSSGSVPVCKNRYSKCSPGLCGSSAIFRVLCPKTCYSCTALQQQRNWYSDAQCNDMKSMCGQDFVNVVCRSTCAGRRRRKRGDYYLL